MSTRDAVEQAAAVLGPLARHNAPLGALTTYRVGGPAALMVEVMSDGDLLACRRAVRASGVPVLVFGRGSNLLVADAGFPGLALTLGEPFSVVEIEGTRVRAGGGASLPVVARRTADAGLTGFEWAVGVPGSVGGGVRMNAGGHGSDISRSFESARVADLAADNEEDVVSELPAADLEFSYRRSAVGPGQVVVGATFVLEAGDRQVSRDTIAEIVRWRRENQPGGMNAGSVFTNPPGDAAGRLIDAAGLKGFRRGSAVVSPKHANFFQVDDGGSAGDVRSLIEEVAELVEERTGVRLWPEIRMVGFDTGAAEPFDLKERKT